MLLQVQSTASDKQTLSMHSKRSLCMSCTLWAAHFADVFAVYSFWPLSPQQIKGRFRLAIKKEILYSEGGEALDQVAQRSCGCPLPGSVQGQAGWGFEQPGLVEGVPAHGRGGWTKWSTRSRPTQIIWWVNEIVCVQLHCYCRNLGRAEILGISLPLKCASGSWWFILFLISRWQFLLLGEKTSVLQSTDVFFVAVVVTVTFCLWAGMPKSQLHFSHAFSTSLTV